MTRKSIGWIAIMALCASGLVSVAMATEMTQSAGADTEKKAAASPKSDSKKPDDKNEAKPNVVENGGAMTEMEFNTIEVITTGRSDNLCAAIAALNVKPTDASETKTP